MMSKLRYCMYEQELNFTARRQGEQRQNKMRKDINKAPSQTKIINDCSTRLIVELQV